MNDSLSIIVPVRNAEATLAGQISRLLDVLPDLTGRFEIVLVDDASTDQTVELARELVSQFPQLRLIRHHDPRGVEAAVRTGLQWASGQTLLVQEDSTMLSASDLRRLWLLRNDEELVLARAAGRTRVFDPALLARLSAWGQSLNTEADQSSDAGGIHMLRRDTALRLLADECIDDEGADDEAPLAPLAATAARADASHPAPRPRRAATFLRHLRNLAMGE